MTEQSTLRNIILKLEAEVVGWQERVELAERKVEAVKNTVEAEKHYNPYCGWDVPVIRIYDALEGYSR